MSSDIATRLIQHPYEAPDTFRAPQPGVFKASTVIFPNVAAMRGTRWDDRSGYSYGLHGTPTSYVLEQRLCELEGGRQCLLVTSGLAAIAVVDSALLVPGDEVLLPDNAYAPGAVFATAELSRRGVSTGWYDPMDAEDLRRRIGPKTRLVWMEAPGSITMEFPDLIGLVRVCRAAGVTCALDNTWGSGLAFAPFDLLPGSGESLGVDISVHALTKYPSGGADVLMGSIMTRDPVLGKRLLECHQHYGFGVGMNDVELVLRSLPSIALRYRAHDAAARALASWCATQPAFAQVLHPALDGAPGHAHWRQLCRPDAGGAAGLFSVMVDPRFSSQQVDAFCDALRLFKLGYSWGGPVSLVVPYNLGAMRPKWPAQVKSGTIVRFSIGLEDEADLRADIAQALAATLR